MRIHLIRKETIADYVLENARSKPSFTAWLTAVKYADWAMPSDMHDTFGTADLISGGTNRVVFDVGGNNYRMICKYAFGEKQVHLFICWIGTHTEYTELCRHNEQYTITNY
jgi:mRNA interferase HigB